MTPHLLVAGHIVKDKENGVWRAGGGAYYAAAQASRLGVATAGVTACSAEAQPRELVPGVEWHVAAHAGEIAFENRYRDGVRTQRVESTARPLTLDDVPEAWRHAPLVLLTPVLHDVDADWPRALAGPGRRVALAAQGWLRRVEGGAVRAGRFEPRPAWLHGDFVFLSEEDIDEPEAVEAWAEDGRVVVLTRGERGVTVWRSAERRDFPALKAEAIDPTGAGDVFAVSFLVRYEETRDIEVSAAFAAAAAALAVEGEGIAGLGDRRAIEARLETERVKA